MDHGHGPLEYQYHNDHALVVCDHVDGRIRLSGILLAGFITNENVNLPYQSRVKKVDYGWIISVTVKRLVTNHILSVRSRVTSPRPMQLSKLFWISTSIANFCSCRANNGYYLNTEIKQGCSGLQKSSDIQDIDKIYTKLGFIFPLHFIATASKSTDSYHFNTSVTNIHILENYFTNYTAKLRKFQKRNTTKLERKATDLK